MKKLVVEDLSEIFEKIYETNSRTSAIIIIINHFTNIIIIIICKNNFAICNVLINFTKDAINK